MKPLNRGLTLTRAIELVRWFDRQRNTVTAAMVVERFDVARATAYRYIRQFRDSP